MMKQDDAVLAKEKARQLQRALARALGETPSLPGCQDLIAFVHGFSSHWDLIRNHEHRERIDPDESISPGELRVRRSTQAWLLVNKLGIDFETAWRVIEEAAPTARQSGTVEVTPRSGGLKSRMAARWGCGGDRDA
jgi:hypothetical protein